MNKLHLHQLHESLGASFTEQGGWLIPGSYANKLGEYEAVRKNAGITDLSHRGKLRLSGKEHLKFLQGMLTNDVVKLPVGSGMYATILTVKGRVLSDMNVYRGEDYVFLDMEPGLNEKVGDLLKKFRLSYKADIEDMTKSLGLLSVHGPRARGLVQELLGGGVAEMSERSHFKADVEGMEVTAVRINRTGEEGYDLYAGSESLGNLWELLSGRGADSGLEPVGSDALEILRIEAGIPVYDRDMDESTIPIEAGLWHALDFEKGCYVGQEVVARIKWRGHVNRHLTGFIIDGDELPLRDDEIYNGDKKVGRVTSSVFSPVLGRPVALGYIRREFREPGTRVSIHSAGAQTLNAGVSELPFYKGSSGEKKL
ncbi:MAG: aminomethyltransferase family protein [Deltaproteobacteria bacterium]